MVNYRSNNSCLRSLRASFRARYRCDDQRASMYDIVVHIHGPHSLGSAQTSHCTHERAKSVSLCVWSADDCAINRNNPFLAALLTHWRVFAALLQPDCSTRSLLQSLRPSKLNLSIGTQQTRSHRLLLAFRQTHTCLPNSVHSVARLSWPARMS